MATKNFFPDVNTQPPQDRPVSPNHEAPTGAAAEEIDFRLTIDSTTGLLIPIDVKGGFEVIASQTLDQTATFRLAGTAAVQCTAALLGVTNSAPTYKDLALGLICESELKTKLVSFIEEEQPPVQQSLVPIDSFTGNRLRSDWDTHCPVVKEEWERFCSTVSNVSEGKINIREMAAPSGPAKARLTMIWHYPTFTSPHSVFGHVMDPDSPSLWVQKAKIGLPRDVRTQDVFPMRVPYDPVKGPQWSIRYPNWPAIQATCLEHLNSLTGNDRLLVVLGDEMWQDVKRSITNRGLDLTYVEVQAGYRMFGTLPRIYIALNEQKRVQQIFIRVFHGQYAFTNSSEPRGALWDLMWNTACEFAGVPVESPGFFAWAAQHRFRSSCLNPDAVSMTPKPWTVFLALRRREQQQNRSLTVQEVHHYFPTLLVKYTELADKIQQAFGKGHTPLSAIESHFVDLANNTKAKRATEHPIIPPAPKRAATDTKKVEAAIASAAARKENKDKKWAAFLKTHQVLDAEANRTNPERTMTQSRTLQRVDKMKELLEGNNKDSYKFNNEFCKWAVFYHPVKYPRGIRYLPEHGIDPYDGQDHPGNVIARNSRLSNATDRNSVAGPLEE